MVIDGQVEELMYAYNGMLFSLQKEEVSHECYTMDEPGGHYTAKKKKKKPVKKDIRYLMLFTKLNVQK